MAATMKAKMSKHKLNKIDIIKICEEILHPAVPMALRISGILMGGVVIVYERKVNILYEDVNRVLDEINKAWKVKAKPKAKPKAVTLPEAVDMEVDQSNFSNAANKNIWSLDDKRLLEELGINADGQCKKHHQADAASITLIDDFSCLAENYFNNQFERFDMDGDEEMFVNFTQQDNQIPTSSPPGQDAAEEPPFSRVSSPRANQQEAQDDETRVPMTEDGEDLNIQKPRKRSQVIIDDHTMIPENTYQEWLQDASSLMRKRGRKIKPRHPIFTTKIDILMEIPPVALLTGFENFPNQLHYPPRLLELWRKSTSNDLPSAARQKVTSHSPPETLSHHENFAPEFANGAHSSGNGSQPGASSAESLRAEFQAVFNDPNVGSNEHFSTPISPGRHSSGSFHGSASGNVSLPTEQEILPSAARGKKRQHSELGNLYPVEEDIPLVQGTSGLKIQNSSKDNRAHDSDLLEETIGSTQTPHPIFSNPTVDEVTQSIRRQFKMNFETLGHQVESINDLASGMNRKMAASLFFQTCVLATNDCVKVDQEAPYGDILIFKGPNL